MNIFKFITNSLFIALIAVIAFLAFVRSGEFLAFQQNKLRTEAIDSCYHISKFISVKTEEGITIEEPVVDKFQGCLEMKGIE